MRTRTPAFDRNILVLSVAAVFLVGATACGTGDSTSDQVGDAADVLEDTDSTDNDAAADGSGDGSGLEVITLADGVTATILPENSRVIALKAADWAWEGFNHRVSELGVWPTQGPDGEVQSAEFTFVGGDFTTGAIAEDDAIVSARWVSFAASRAVYIDVRAMVPSDETLIQEIDISSLLPLWGESEVVTALVGFSFNTGVEQPADYPAGYDPALGFTNRGFSVFALPDSPSRPSRELQVNLRFEHGLAEDEALRADMNAAMPFAQTEAVARFVIFVPANDAPKQSLFHDFQFKQEGEPPRFTSALQPEPPDELRSFDYGLPGVPVGEAVMRGFGLELFEHCFFANECDAPAECFNGCEYEAFPPGEYIRRFAVGIETGLCNEDPSACQFRATMHVGNESQGPVFRSMRYEARGIFEWVGDPTAIVQEGSAEFPAGTTTVEF